MLAFETLAEICEFPGVSKSYIDILQMVTPPCVTIKHALIGGEFHYMESFLFKSLLLEHKGNRNVIKPRYLHFVTFKK